MIRILEIKMHWNAIAHGLLGKFGAEVKIDLMLISEQ